jgi:TrmH family RNA methyltransferase
MPAITSPQNPRLARVRALLEKRRQRDEEHAFVVEGVRLVEEGLSAGWQADLVLYTAGLSERGQAAVERFVSAGVETLEVAPRLMDSITATETPQGLLAVFRRRDFSLPQKLDFALITDNLRDPGNLGTLLRSAAAAGVQAVLLSPGTTDAFAPKVLRAGMGAHFRLPIFTCPWNDLHAACRSRGLRVYLAEAADGDSCWDLDLSGPLALLVGSEAEGASPQARSLADSLIHIPMPGHSESLNAAVAASVLLFEVVRQRRTGR